MESLSKIALTQQPNGSGLLKTTSALPLQEGMALVELMAQAQAFKPNQTLPPGTPDLYLQAWEEIVQTYGMERFKEGLWKALRRSTFFPAPNEIEDSCEGLRRAAGESRQASETRALLDDMEAAAKHRREHPEEYFSMPDLVAEVMARIAAKKGGLL